MRLASGLRAADSADAKSAVPAAPITSRPGRNFRVAGLGVPSVSMNMEAVLVREWLPIPDEGGLFWAPVQRARRPVQDRPGPSGRHGPGRIAARLPAAVTSP